MCGEGHCGRDRTTGPSHVSVRNDFPGQMKGKPVERNGVVAVSSGVAVLNGDGKSPWWHGTAGPGHCRNKWRGCHEKAEQRYSENGSVLRNWSSDISLYQSFSEYLLAPITPSPFMSLQPLLSLLTLSFFLSGLRIS